MTTIKRIIKFRGKPVGGEDFVYGSLVQAADGVFIVEEGTDVTFTEPDFHKSAMGCGLEDKGITDRYEAMEHGFQEGVERCERNHPDFVEVDPETVGQFTGLMDHSDPKKEIYEGDICRAQDTVFQISWNSKESYREVGFTIEKGLLIMPVFPADSVHWEVIGNIYDNPELIQG